MLLTLEEIEPLVHETPELALKELNDILDKDPDNSGALYMVGSILLMQERFGLAYTILERVTRLSPYRGEGWNSLGMAIEKTNEKKAKEHFKRAIKVDPSLPFPYANLALIHLNKGQPKKAIELCDKALAIDPNNFPANCNGGQAKLMLRNWGEGWDHISKILGDKHRKKIDHGLLDWHGEKGKVLVYGEQGIGDEVLFSSIIPDLQTSNEVVINCDPRLVNLFKRSFGCEVYGNRWKKEIPVHNAAYQCAIGDLARYFRREGQDFTGISYLTPDRERCIQWRALLDQYPGKKIGIAWSGGINRTSRKKRSLQLSDLDPILETNNTFVCLEYGDVNVSELRERGILYWPRAVKKGVDIDETLALINELDLIITVTTSVVHFAGAIGKECWTLVPREPNYRFHLEGDMPWHNSVKLFRQAKEWPIDSIVRRLKC